MSEVVVVVGGQYGSEAKGHVTAQVILKEISANENDDIINVRVAGPNAGHTVYDAAGHKFAFRQLPVGAVLGNSAESPVSVIAAGSEVDPEVLIAEIDLARSRGHVGAIMVDGNATVIEQRHKDEEGHVDLVGKIGSTGKGIGAARASRIMRNAQRVRDTDSLVQDLEDRGVVVADTVEMLAYWATLDRVFIVVEGTQGYGLGLHLDAYPQVTSSDARAIDFLAMAGISPWQHGVVSTTVVIAARVYPIRVAGNSGPMQEETTWGELGLPEERTTVTQKVRRVGHWDKELIRAAVLANGGANPDPTRPPSVVVALTMIDQLIPELADFELCEPSKCKGHPQVTKEVNRELNRFLRKVTEDSGAPVVMFTTGPQTAVWL
jgi:adenylosuccinate synthase